MSDKKMATIQALLDRADHPNTPAAEADSCRAKAEEMMVKYRIEEEQLRATKLASGTAEQPIEAEIIVCAFSNTYRNHYYSLALWLADHCGVRAISDYKKVVEDGVEEFSVVLKVVGFESDIAYLEMLYIGVRMTFSNLLEPKRNANESDEDNVYRLRNAGMERHRIATLMGWGGEGTNGPVKVTKLYKQACVARGEDPKVVGKSVNAKTFRETYADAFASRINARLSAMKATAGYETGALVLKGRSDAVDEAFYSRYPHLRPKPVIEGQDYSGCEKCKKAKSGRCRDHSYRAAKPRPYSPLGASAGRAAANAADLSGGRTSSRPGRLEG